MSNKNNFSLKEQQYTQNLLILKVFFRTGTLSHLEDMREEKVSGWVVNLQAICRGFLGRRNRTKVKVMSSVFQSWLLLVVAPSVN